MTSKLQPALLGGLLIGVLSSLPFVGNLNACCCLWVIVGGVLTSYLLQERLPVPITAGDAAVAGLLAGVVGGLLAWAATAVMMALAGGVGSSFDLLRRGDMPPEFARVLDEVEHLPSWIWYVLFLVFHLLVFPIFSMLGALLGVALFKRQPLPPPPGTVEVLPPE